MDANKYEVTVPKKIALMSASDLLRAAWRVYVLRFVDFVEMYLRGLIGVLPLVGVGAVFVLLAWLKIESVPLYILIGVLALLAMLWSIYYGTRARIGLLLLLKDENVSVKENFIRSKPFFWPYLTVSVVTGLLIFLACLLLIFPGIILAISWAFAVMLVVLENKKNATEAMRRSKELVKGYRWPVFWRFLFLVVLALAVSIVLDIPTSFLNDDGDKVYSLVINIFWALLSPLFLAYTYLLYKDLLVKK